MSISHDTRRALDDLITLFWACVDEVTDIPGASLFTETGSLRIESFCATGTAELSRYFAGRRTLSQERGRATRHVLSNLRPLHLTAGEARLQATVTVFSGYGPRPAPLGAPSSLADFIFDCVETAPGIWRFASVTGHLVFAGADTPDLGRATRDAKGAGA